MKLRYPLLALLLVLILAACGGGGGNTAVGSGDVATIGNQHVTKLQFDQSMKQQRLSLKRQGQKFPAVGSTQFSALKNQVLSVLVQNAEFDDEAAKLGVTVSAKDIQTQLDLIKKQYFGGSEAKYQQQLKQQGYDDAEVRDQIRGQILSQRLFTKITANVTASDKDVQAYYDAHKSQYATKGSRDVRYILVGKNKQSLAQSLETPAQGRSGQQVVRARQAVLARSVFQGHLWQGDVPEGPDGSRVRQASVLTAGPRAWPR